MLPNIEWHHVVESLVVIGLAGVVRYLKKTSDSVISIGTDVHVIKTNDLPHIESSLATHTVSINDLQKAFISHLDRPHSSREGDSK